MNNVVLELKDVKKSFTDTEVLKGISLSIEAGEFITFLGSSGCGKTTTLRIIAGLEMPDSGSVILNGQDVTGHAPEKRDVNTVFQNYALFPHMNVYDNVAYSMKIRKIKKQEIRERVTKALDMVQLSGFEKRMPAQMSGGQKQRVAIARAIVNNPRVLLLDEPLGALDLQLRRQMQTELKRLQKKLGITFIYITHDQEEAINMSDRIVVMKEGCFEQIGTPDEIYNQPRTAYVATFVGNANIFYGTLKRDNEKSFICIGKGRAPVKRSGEKAEGAQVSAAVRSENIILNKNEKEGGFPAKVKEKSFTGGMLRLMLLLEDGTEVVASRHGIDAGYQIGEQLYCTWAPEHAVLVD